MPTLSQAASNLLRSTFRSVLGARLVDYNQSARIQGLRSTVSIRRDRYAVPHIEAATARDAYFALGYCVAQDRSFQLELFWRVCHGTLAEIVGKKVLPIDRLSRRVGFLRRSQEQLDAMDDEVRDILVAYAQGINAGREHGVDRKAHELSILRTEPTPWRADDVVGMMRFVAFINNQSWDTQLSRLRILDADGAEGTLAVETGVHPEDPVSRPPGAAFGELVHDLAEEIAELEHWLGKGGASNNWVIGSERTKTGRPILANDPHLDTSLPCQFYLAHLRAPDLHVAGATFVGAPAFAPGHNEQVAWGMTNGKADAARLYVEKLSADGRQALVGDRWEDCEVVEESIAVRRGEPVVERITITKRGPVITPALGGRTEHALSFAASWMTPMPLRGLLTVPQTNDFPSFRRQFERWPSAPLNIVYADVHGTVGWQLIGEVPANASDLGRLPGVPKPDSYEDIMPFDRLPFYQGGPGDAFGTANNPPTTGASDPLLGLHWTAGYRARRIYEALGQKTDWSIRDCLALQMDLKTTVWTEIAELVTGLDVSDGAAALALSLLRSWDGVLASSSAAAAVYELFIDEMAGRITRAKAPNAYRIACGESQHELSPFTNYAMTRVSHTARLLRSQPEGYFEDGWPMEMERALASAVARLRQGQGQDSTTWQWGRLRPLTLAHPIGKGPLAAIFNIGPFPWGGDATTLNMTINDPTDPTARPLVCATLRAVMDVGDWGQSRFILHGGQSGNPYSPHYRDMFELWRRGDAPTLAWTEDQVERATVYRCELAPLGVNQGVD